MTLGLSMRLVSIVLLLAQAVISPSLLPCQLGRNVPFGSNSVSPKEDWDYDGKRILGHIGADIYLWDAATGKVLQKLAGHRESPQSLRFSPDGKYILSSSGVRTSGDFPPECKSVDTTSRLWDASSGKQVWEIRNVFAGTFSPDSKRILMLSLRACNDFPATITMWNVSGKKLFDAQGPSVTQSGNMFSAVYTKLAFSQNGHRFVSENSQNNAYLFDADTGKEITSFDRAKSVHFYGSDGQLGIFNGKEASIWSPSGQLMSRIPMTEDDFEGVWSSDGKRLALKKIVDFASWKTVLLLWDLKSDTRVSRGVYGHSLTPSPTSAVGLLWRGGGQANSGYTPLQFTMYDLITGKELWHGQEEAYSFLGFAPDGQTFLVGGGPNFVVYSTKTGEALSNVDLLGTCQGGNGLGGFAPEPHPDCVPGGSR